MWIYTNDSFVSAVAHVEQPDRLLVRARVRGDIERLLPTSIAPRRRVRRTPGADYLFRTIVTREALAEAVAERILTIDYGNFKDSIGTDDPMRHSFYTRIWSESAALQRAMVRTAQEDFLW